MAGCGGGERQDADESSGDYRVEVLDAKFPDAQRLAEQSTFEIRVRNAGTEEIPNLAVTLRGFARRPGLDGGGQTGPDGASAAIEPQSDPDRPVWVVDSEPPGGVTAYDETWTAGKLPAGRTATLRWRVTPVLAGDHTLTYRVAAGLDGKARAVGANGRPPAGKVAVTIDEEPAQARVNPRTGAVERLGE